MATNDIVLIDGIVDSRIGERVPAPNRGDVFEYFAAEQILKTADLSKDELLSGLVDGRDDGGIDAVYILINGHYLAEPNDFVWPRSGAELEFVIITCKHHDTFKEATLDKLVASLTELLNFSIKRADLKGSYSESVLRVRENLAIAYRRLSSVMKSFTFNVIYASRGDTSDIGESVHARGRQIQDLIKRMFGRCNSNFMFIGAAELIDLHRRIRNFELELPFHQCMWQDERYVVLSKLVDYCKFVTDEKGRVLPHLLESNVRDSLGLNRVNDDILETLRNPGTADFWWMNNGVTILGTKATPHGNCLLINDVQIVNGLQTTETIARYFREGGADTSRSILVKVIVSADPTVRDDIIRATNNQTAVDHSSLRATDRVQRDIDEILVRSGLYYDRRRNYYINRGVDASDVISLLYLATGYVSLILKSPSTASEMKQRFVRNETTYRRVFNAQTPLEVWPRIASVLQRTDAILSRLRTVGQSSDGFLRRNRHIVSLLALSRHFKKFSFSAKDLSTLDPNLITDETIESSWRFIVQLQPGNNASGKRVKKSFVKQICDAAASSFSIAQPEAIESHSPFKSTPSPRASVDESFIENVHELLPEQPWKPGIHRVIAAQLKCSALKVSAAIEQLIIEGRRHRQKDGVVFDDDDTVIGYDPDRVDPSNLPRGFDDA